MAYHPYMHKIMISLHVLGQDDPVIIYKIVDQTSNIIDVCSHVDINLNCELHNASFRYNCLSFSLPINQVVTIIAK